MQRFFEEAREARRARINGMIDNRLWWYRYRIGRRVQSLLSPGMLRALIGLYFLVMGAIVLYTGHRWR